MSSSSRRNETIQKWMQQVITHPGGVAEGIADPDACALIDCSIERVDEVILPSRQCSSVERMSVYANAYYARLLECLRLEFPAFRHAVGAEAFDQFALGYLQDRPPSSYTLGQLGAEFPATIARVVAEDSRPRDYDWPGLIADLVMVERVYEEVFDGPGEERSESLTAERLLAIPRERIPELTFRTSDSLRLLKLRFPVHEYISAVRDGQNPEPPAPDPTWLIINRRDYVVRRRTVTPVEYILLDCLQDGVPFGDAIEICLSETSEPIDTVAGRLRDWFQEWTAAGFLIDCQLPGSE